MRHFPAARFHPPLSGLARSRGEAPWWRYRCTLALAAGAIFAAGFFAGAILFGCALLRFNP